jgi:hypothetical protein
VPGKPELLLGSINWLNRTNFFPYYTKTLLLAIGHLSVILSVFYAYRRFSRSGGFLIAICASLLALTTASVFFSWLNHYTYAPPQPRTKYVKVNFELDHSSMFLPISALIGNPQNNFHTFYVWTQRLGYVPRAIASIENAVVDADLVFIINPDKPFTQKEKHLITTFVQRGGRVILMDNALNADSTANEVSQLFGIGLEAEKSCQGIFHDTKDREISATETALNIVGGKPLWITENNCNIFSVVGQGEGWFAVMSDSRLFSNITMGSTGSPPTPEQLKVYELEFWMLRKMVEPEPDFDRAG